MGDEQPVAGIIEPEFFPSLKLRNPLKLPAVGWDSIHIVRIRCLGIAQHVEPSAVRGQSRFRYLEAPLGDGVRLSIRRLGVQMRETGFLGFVPERAVVREPADFVESPT